MSSSWLLTLGCTLLAFSPTSSLLFLLTYHKAHLIIVVTTSAFAYLISSLFSSLLWLGLYVDKLRSNAILLIVPSILCQALARCGFVLIYFKVESVIEKSIIAHEREEYTTQQRHRLQRQANNNGTNGTTSDQQRQEEDEHPEQQQHRLRHELNDWSCGLAAGVGYGGMHTLMLYGTLLASESGGKGTLYQSSCPYMPSLVNSAIIALLFSLLDYVLVLLTFFGMRRRQQQCGGVGGRRRRRQLPQRSPSGVPLVGQHISNLESPHHDSTTTTTNDDEERKWGNIALLSTIIIHGIAGFTTVANNLEGGCLISLPLLFILVLVTWIGFMIWIRPRYLPSEQRRLVVVGGGGRSGMTPPHED